MSNQVVLPTKVQYRDVSVRIYGRCGYLLRSVAAVLGQRCAYCDRCRHTQDGNK